MNNTMNPNNEPMTEKPMRYIVKEDSQNIKVWDTKNKVWITKPLPSMEIANEIADDFNKMDNKNFTPLGLPNFGKLNQKGEGHGII